MTHSIRCRRVIVEGRLFLVGSRAIGSARESSDWDIYWRPRRIPKQENRGPIQRAGKRIARIARAHLGLPETARVDVFLPVARTAWSCREEATGRVVHFPPAIAIEHSQTGGCVGLSDESLAEAEADAVREAENKEMRK